MGTVQRLSFLILIIALLAAPPAALAAPAGQSGATHVVQRGETLTSIAARYGVSAAALAQANGISNPSLIYAGQRLAIPGAGSPSPITPASSRTVHVVRPGETLSAIAARYGLSTSALAQANGISNPSLIRSGQRLAIPTGAAGSANTIVNSGAASSANVHVVRSGENLASIARQYRTTVGAIVAANGIADPSRIFSGQRLVIPDRAAPPVQPQSGLSVQVSISSQRCWVYRGQQLLYDWPCSTGRAGAPTRAGTFYVQSKIREAWGSAFGFYMPYWLGIYWAGSTENGIHGLPYAPGGRPIWANALGTPVTYGCVLLGAEESKALWEMAYVGMPVTITP